MLLLLLNGNVHLVASLVLSGMVRVVLVVVVVMLVLVLVMLVELELLVAPDMVELGPVGSDVVLVHIGQLGVGYVVHEVKIGACTCDGSV